MVNNSFIPDAPVLVIGAAAVDIVGRLKTQLQPGTSNPAQIRTSFGGVARNVAENLTRLGQPVILLTVVGKDHAGYQLLKAATEAGINVDHVLHTDQHSTSTYLAVIDENGILQVALDDMSAISMLTSEYIRLKKSLFQTATMVFIDANLPKEVIRTVTTLAKHAHIPVSADPTSTNLASRLKPYLSRFYLVTPNVSEAQVLCGYPFDASQSYQVIEVAKCLVSSGVEMAIITLAEYGVCYATSETSGYVPAIRTDVIDPTGADDALTATVLFAIINQIPIDDAVRLGVTAATLTLRYPGTVVPDLSLEKLYDKLVF